MGLLDKFMTQNNQGEVDLTLQGALQDDYSTYITRKEAMAIPSIYAGTDLIAGVVAGLQIKLYKEVDGVVEEVKDNRLMLLNDDTNNYMNGVDLKRSITKDLLLDGSFFIYRNGIGADTSALHYVEPWDVSILSNEQPIFREYKILVEGIEYPMSRFIMGMKDSVDGVRGNGMLNFLNDTLYQSIKTQEYMTNNIETGGIKRGVLESSERLTKEAVASLKTAWKTLYKGNNDCIVLNKGITYRELQQSAGELELIDNKKDIDNSIYTALGIPTGLMNAEDPDPAFKLFLRTAVTPLLNIIESALNRSLLTSSEKGNHYFAFDTKEINKADIESRFKAYEVAIKSGIMTPSEVRYEENLPQDERFNVLKLSLGDVLLKENGEIYTPNMDTTSNLTGNQSEREVMEGGDDENDENRN